MSLCLCLDHMVLSVDNMRLHEMPCPSVLKEIEMKSLQNSAGKVYSENINNVFTGSLHHGISNAGDTRHVK